MPYTASAEDLRLSDSCSNPSTEWSGVKRRAKALRSHELGVTRPHVHDGPGRSNGRAGKRYTTHRERSLRTDAYLPVSPARGRKLSPEREPDAASVVPWLPPGAHLQWRPESRPNSCPSNSL